MTTDGMAALRMLVRISPSILTAAIAIALSGCVATQNFSCPHPTDSRRTLTVTISRNAFDTFRLIIDGTLVLQRKLRLETGETISWDTASGTFEGEHVLLSCSRDRSDGTSTWCNVTIGSGPPAGGKIY